MAPLVADDINQRLAARVAGLRRGQGLVAGHAGGALRREPLDALADRARRDECDGGVLEKVAAGLGVALAALFEIERRAPGPLMRRAEQIEWRDPASGHLRRNVPPPDHRSPLRIVEAGDCLAMRLDGPVEFCNPTRNPTRKPARNPTRCAVVIIDDTTRQRQSPR